jgi:hypothetical protein
VCVNFIGESGFVLGGVAAVCIYKEVVDEKRAERVGLAGGVRGDYDYESLSRVPTMELLEAHALGSGAGAVFKHKVGGGGGGGGGSSQSSSPVSGSPSAATLRKPTLLSSPYASPVKNPGHRRPSASGSTFGAGAGIADSEFVGGIAASGSALFKNIPDFRPFQRSGPSSGGGKFDLLPTTT